MEGAYRLEFKKSLKIKPPPDITQPDTRLKLKIFMRCSPMQTINKAKGKPQDNFKV